MSCLLCFCLLTLFLGSVTAASELACRENEIINNCPVDCLADYCPTNEEDDKVPCPEPDTCPEPFCKCRFNYRLANGTCISTRSCPPFPCTKPNEEYHPCPPWCPTDKCNQATLTGKCPLPGRILAILKCRPKCRCIKGYWRQDDGVCVPYAECPHIKSQYTTVATNPIEENNGTDGSTSFDTLSLSKGSVNDFEV